MPRMTRSLQESIVTLVLMDSEKGAIAAGMITPELFEYPYTELIKRGIDYHAKFGDAPGRAHIDDIFDDLLANPKHEGVYQNILIGVIEQSVGLNTDYVLSKVSAFVRAQTLKKAITDAGRIYVNGQEAEQVSEIEAILNSALRSPTNTPDAGVFLNDQAALNFLDNPRKIISTAVPQLDQIECGPSRGELLAFLGAKGFGKSWFCIHLAKQALKYNFRVAYITLEMSRDQVIKRLFQSMLGIGKRKESFRTADIRMTESLGFEDIEFFRKRPQRSLADSNIRSFIAKKQSTWGVRLGRIVVKQFPTHSLTTPMLYAYLDGLELHDKFVPDLLIVDSPMLMRQRADDLRLSYGQTVVALRGLLGERNMAGVATWQLNKQAWTMKRPRGDKVSEDASVLMTADSVLIGMKTEHEKSIGLARMYVEKNRDDRDGGTLLITQALDIGKFITSSAWMPDNYDGILKDKGYAGDDND